MSRPVFEYTDYREFLKERVEDLKKAKRVSHRSICMRAGFKSPSYLRMILDGERNLTGSTARRISKALGLKSPEARYFEYLVEFSHSKLPSEKEEAYQRLLSVRKQETSTRRRVDEFEYLKNWYHVALREALTVKHWRFDEDRLSKQLGITKKQLQDAIDLLIRLGFVKQTNEGYEAQDAALVTPSEMKSLVVRSFHREMIRRALLSVDRLPQDQRDLSSLTIPISKKNYQQLKKRVAAFRRELNGLLSDDNEASNVYQINIQVFPLLSISEEGKDEF